MKLDLCYRCKKYLASPLDISSELNFVWCISCLVWDSTHNLYSIGGNNQRTVLKKYIEEHPEIALEVE